MSGNLPVPQAAELKITWALSGQPAAINVLHFDHDLGSTMTQAKADAIATLVRTAFTASQLATVIASTVTLLRVETRHMDSNTDPWWVGAGTAVPGTSVGHPLPAATAYVVTLKTGLRGRSYNGRVYLWGYTEDANDAAGGITPLAAQYSLDFVNNIKSNMASAQQMDMGVVSRWTTPVSAPPGTPPTERNPPIITPVSTVTLRDSRWDVQRRRAIPGI